MIVKLPPNIPFRLQSKESMQNYSSNSALTFAGGAVAVANDLCQFTKKREILTHATYIKLGLAECIAELAKLEAKEFFEQHSAKLLKKIADKLGKKGLYPTVDCNFKCSLGFSNSGSKRKPGTPIKKLILASSGEIPGDYRVIEGKKVFDIYLSKNSDTKNAGYIVLAEGSAMPREGFNVAVKRIVEELVESSHANSSL